MGIRRLEWLTSIWTILAAFVLGGVLGLALPEVALQVARIGDLYVTFLIMCVPPIMLTALSSSLARLLNDQAAAAHMRRIVSGLLLSMLVVASVSAIGILAFKPGVGLSTEARLVIGTHLEEAESPTVGGATGWGQLLMGLVPQNMFAAVAEGNYPQILFISVLLGLLMGFVRGPATDRMLELTELVFQLFQQAIMWSTYVLPFAVVGIVAGQVASVGPQLMVAMAKMLLACIVISLTLAVVGVVVLVRATGTPWRELWPALKKPLTFALATSNSMATMPVLMDALEELRLPRSMINLVVPLCILIGRHAFVVYGVQVLLFTVQLYDLPLTLGAVAAIIVGAVFVSVATAGMPAVPFLTALTIVAAPLGIPMEAVIPIQLAILPLYDPIGTFAAVQVQATTATMIIGRPQETAATSRGPGAQTATPAAS